MDQPPTQYFNYDMLRYIKTVSDPDISPDESCIAYTLGWIDTDTFTNKSRIMGITSDSHLAKELTSGEKDSAPKFSPDGQVLAFLRVDENDKRQIMVSPVSGSHPQQITDQAEGILEFDWSPSSNKLVFSSLTESDINLGDTGTSDNSPVKIASKLKYQFDTLGWRGNSHFHLFVVDTNDLQTVQITDGNSDNLSPTWSPNGDKIAFISGRRPENDVHALTEVYVTESHGGPAELWSDSLASVSAISWAPDGSRLLAIGSETPGFLSTWQGWLYSLTPENSPSKHSDDSFRPSVGFPGISSSPEIKWTSTASVILLGDSEGESYVYRVDLKTNSVERIGTGGILASDMSANNSGDKVVISCSSTGDPSTLIELDLTRDMSSTLTSHNDAYIAQVIQPSMEKFTIAQPDFDIECRVFYPPRFDPSSTYPLILDIHGGPNGAFYDSFVPWQQMFASQGYIVLAVNPRGSSTYGDSFMMSVINDWGGNDYNDLMAAVDHIAKRPYVDSNRLAVHGYSYGGYMTSWIIGHTNRFKAAVIGAPCINLHSMYGTSDIGTSFGELQWGVSLEVGTPESYILFANQLLSKSPITYASQVETPALLLHGESDHRCPIGQSEEYFTLLKRLGKNVEMVRFPESSHLFPRLGKPVMREAYLKHALQWFDLYV